jgi:lipoate-protein ligase A
MVVISVAGRTALPFRLRDHMNLVNLRIMAALARLGVRDLTLRGISDISLGEQKVLGSSLYRKGDTVLYQGSLLVNPDLGLIDRYLKHPLKEPAYRRHRPHATFLTTLHAREYHLSTEQIAAEIEETLGEYNPWCGKQAEMQPPEASTRQNQSYDKPVQAAGGETHGLA